MKSLATPSTLPSAMRAATPLTSTAFRCRRRHWISARRLIPSCWVLSVALWLVANLSGGKLEILNFGVLQSSALYRLLEPLNPFVVRY